MKIKVICFLGFPLPSWPNFLQIVPSSSSFNNVLVILCSGTKKPWKPEPWNWKSEILKNSRGFDNSDSLVHELHEKW